MSGFRPRLVAVLGGAALLTALIASPASVAANGGSILYVGPGGGPGGCASPAYSDIQSAVGAASPGDTVHVCAATYTVVTAIRVAQNLSIVGDGAATTIVDGWGNRQLFWTEYGNTVSFTGLTLREGDTGGDGGAIEGSDVVIVNCVFSGNYADHDGGAIAADVVTVTNSTFTDNTSWDGDGGAIRAYGSATIVNSTFTGNDASYYDGGAIDAGTAVVSGSTFVDNYSDDDGGAIFADMITVSNSTFSLNEAWDDGGAIRAYDGGSIANSTFSGNRADNGNAVRGGGPTTISNAIVAGEYPQYTGSIVSGGGNVGTDDTCGGTEKTEAEIALSPLANNGGPTQTMALGATSAAIDAGIGATCAAAPVSGKDQRGIVRPAGATCDSGAFERVVAFDPTPTIVMFSPLSGKVGSTVTLTGTNFTYVNAVTFNGVRANFQLRSPSVIVTTVPAGATTGRIRVSTSYLTSAQSPNSFVVLR